MIIAVDGMGGDHSPSAVVEGCVQAIKEYNVTVLLTGPKEILEQELNKYEYEKEKIRIIDAREIISPNEHPVTAIRKKKNSSLNVALNLVKSKEADGVISAGSTGAFMAGSLFVVGRIKGIDRPALAPISAVTSISSSSSYKSSSIVTARFKTSVTLSVKLSFVFARPFFNLSKNPPSIKIPPIQQI